MTAKRPTARRRRERAGWAERAPTATLGTGRAVESEAGLFTASKCIQLFERRKVLNEILNGASGVDGFQHLYRQLQEIGLGDDAQKPALVIHHRQAAELVL